jgi:hypothetical protein
MHSIIFIGRSNKESSNRCKRAPLQVRSSIGGSLILRSIARSSAIPESLICIILLTLERIRPPVRPVFSTVLRMSGQLILLVLPQDQNKATSQNKYDTSHYRNTLMMSIVNDPYTTWQYFRFAILLSLFLSPTCHENTQEWVNH